MYIISFGCSFIYGSDLSDNGNGWFDQLPDGSWRPRFSRSTWPALLAKQLDREYNCYALPGIGNLQIADQVLNQIAQNNEGLYIISWSYIDRFDYLAAKNNTWTTITPSDNTLVARNYYKDLQSQYREKLTTLINIKLVIDTLKQKGYPFIMTYMDDLIFETDQHCKPAIVDLQNYIRPYMTTFEGQTFLDWSRNKGFPESKHLHPLEQAHAAAAEYMLELGIYKI